MPMIVKLFAHWHHSVTSFYILYFGKMEELSCTKLISYNINNFKKKIKFGWLILKFSSIIFFLIS